MPKPSIKQRWTQFLECDHTQAGCDRLLANKTHTVLVYYCNKDYPSGMEDGWVYLSIKRNDRLAECDWRIFQRIKNDIVGQDREAVQLFPATSRVVDTCNQYHLWVAPRSNIIGIGSVDGVVSEKCVNGSVQREFAVDDPLRSLIREPAYEGTVMYPLPMYPTELFRFLMGNEYRKMSPKEQRNLLARFLPHDPMDTTKGGGGIPTRPSRSLSLLGGSQWWRRWLRRSP